MAEILVRCTPKQRERIKAKAEALKLSMSSYLLRRGLGDNRARDKEDSTSLANLYSELIGLNQSLKAMPSSELQQQAISVCREVGREVILYRLARQAERS